jgi:uncharacterized protein (TIGR03435 family)
MPLRRTLILAAALAPFTASAQTASPPEGQSVARNKLSFEAASVRQSAPGVPYVGNVDLDGTDFSARYHGGLVKSDGLLINYIFFAYKLQSLSQYQLINAQLPKWAQNARFVVEARPEGSPTKDQIRLMMQSLLADRFKLAVHTESRQLPMYALVLDRPGRLGPELDPHPDDGLCTKVPDKTPPMDKNSLPPFCMLITFAENPQLSHTRIMDFTMEQIASGLEQIGMAIGGLDQIPILDRTGLSGKFDINVKFKRRARTGQAPDPQSQPEEPGASFVEALKIQAGLKLVRQIGPVDVLVIDHVEPPSEN